MKAAGLLFLVCLCAASETPEKGNVIPFDRTDAKQCKAVMIEGRAMRETVHGGTSVAVGESVGTRDGYFRVFVLVRQVGPGKIEVKPKQFSVLYSDAAKTRFSFYDKAAEINQRRREAARTHADDEAELPVSPRLPGYTGPLQSQGSTKAAKLGQLRKPDLNEIAGREDAATQEGRAAGARLGTTVTPEQLYLVRSTLKQGDFAEGFVYFKRPRRSKVHVGLNDTLREIDLPVNGIVFRFN